MTNTYQGDVKINKNNQKEWEEKLKGISKITGYLSIYSNAELKADKLESVGGYLSIYSNAELKADKLESVGGDLFINFNAELKALKSVGGDLYINSNPWLEKQLWKHCKKNRWHITEKSSEWLIKKNGNFEYRLNNVEFKREWFDKIRKDQLTVEEVFAIDNIEHRRIAYEFMDKSKMKSIKDFKVLDEQTDDKGNKMKIVSFTVQNMKKPLKFYNCICPSSKREYFVGTDKDTCWEAKNSSFGLEEVEWVNEW